ncbi:Uncharacterized protein TCM_037813 [Theobroma cacao]|uniref:Uncharacterized protein n=1 Tax=Theobroma cacao TaxID=3641 RepID=A0A061GLH5_THECC|nr:Uncharacterized protein TCM_037813 [Theobroma cacao]
MTKFNSLQYFETKKKRNKEKVEKKKWSSFTNTHAMNTPHTSMFFLSLEIESSWCLCIVEVTCCFALISLLVSVDSGSERWKSFYLFPIFASIFWRFKFGRLSFLIFSFLFFFLCDAAGFFFFMLLDFFSDSWFLLFYG